jgi:Yip1 domain
MPFARSSAPPFMNDIATTPGKAAAPNVFARFIGIITAPKDTFQRVVASPKWLGMLVLTVVIIAFFTALPMTTDAGRQATVDQQVASMKSFGVEVTDELYDRLEQGAGRAPYTTAIFILIVSPIMALIVAGLLFAVFNAALGGEASFKQVYAVVIHAGAISALSALFSGVVNYFRGAVGSVANLAALLPMLPEHSFVANLLSTIDIFLVWYVVVLAIGLAVLYRRRTQPIAVGLFAVYAVIAFAIAAIKTVRGGA